VPKRPAPVMIAAFTGWNDAGSAASALISHLAVQWRAEKTHELNPEDFHDFQVNRPIVMRGPDGKRQIHWPTTTVWVARLPHRTYVLVDGIEPSFRWRQYCEELLDIAADLKVEAIITVGALMADVPHTRPFPLTATSDDPEISEALELDISDYEGPTGIVGVLQSAATNAGIDAISLWVAVPHYVADPPSPKATLALVTRLEELIDDSIDLGSLPEEAAAWDKEVQEMVDDDDDVISYVKMLEEASDTANMPEASGEAIAKEFESWLRKKDVS